MAKNHKNKSKAKVQRRKKNTMSKSKRARAGVANTPRINAISNRMGPVSTISTAPVAIGNSISGFKSQVFHTVNGCRVVGRDFGFTPASTGTVATWANTGGMPLTPACMPSTALRNFVQMYNRFKINRLAFHYITSSPTTSTGDILFYHSKQSSSQLPNNTSASFLPYVLSDSLTVLGPQWTNHTCLVEPRSNWCDTDYGANANEPSLYSTGDVFLYSKTSTTDSPGYVIFDYDISFAELSVAPRAGALPTIKAQWLPFAGTTSGAQTAGSGVISFTTSSTSGVGGSTITALSTVAVNGDVFEVTIDATNSTFTNTTVSNFAQSDILGVGVNMTLTDGEVFYLVYKNSTTSFIYPNLAEALTNGYALLYGASVTYNETIRGYAKFITSINPEQFKQVY